MAVSGFKQHELDALKARQEAGYPVPTLDNEPDVDVAVAPVLACFWRLRNSTPADSPIPYSEKVTAYEREFAFMPEPTFMALVNACDGEYVKFRNELWEKKSKDMRKPNKPSLPGRKA